ncbi:MAG: GGDEF domain-containing protein [Lachnospiraceae bacterium]|nr:GGDEF domain-containing protein [Lachnospiraceae bacterium]
MQDNASLVYQFDLLKEENRQLSLDKHIFDKFLDVSGNAYFCYGFENGNFHCVGNFAGMLGVDVNTIDDIALIRDVIKAEEADTVMDILSTDPEKNADIITKEFALKTGRKWIEINAFTIRDDEGFPVEKYVCFRNITRLKVQKDELTYLAYYDNQTGLINRNFFIEQLNDRVEKAREEHVPMHVALVDIDSFKRINDSLGLVYGDELIMLFGQYLSSFNNERITVGRFGTDVFVISVYDPGKDASIEAVVEKIRERLKKPFILSNKDEIYLSVTVGVAVFPDSADTGLGVLQNAEICVYAAKDSDREKIHYFDTTMMKKFLESFEVEKRLQDAILMQNFVLFYQPQYNVSTGQLRGCEALIRWKEHDGSYIPPMKFIPLAEKSGGIIPIGQWVIRTAVSKLEEWRQKYNFNGIMSINISAIQLKKDSFVDDLIMFLRSAKIDPENIEIEITESVLIEKTSEIIEKVSRMRQFGLKIALDDFGTGFSSLSYLRSLPISTLKIDKSFIDTVISDDTTGIITESVVNMVRRLGLETIAEGVEEEGQMDFLKKINCDNIQGYLLGKPMTEKDFEKIVLEAAI